MMIKKSGGFYSPLWIIFHGSCNASTIGQVVIILITDPILLYQANT